MPRTGVGGEAWATTTREGVGGDAMDTRSSAPAALPALPPVRSGTGRVFAPFVPDADATERPP